MRFGLVRVVLLAVATLVAGRSRGGFSRLSALNLTWAQDRFLSSVIDPTNGFAYYGCESSPGQVIKVRLSNFTVAGVLVLGHGQYFLTNAVLDAVAGFAYFLAEDRNGGFMALTKIRLSDFSEVGILAVGASGEGFVAMALDTANGFIYLGGVGSSEDARVVKVRLADFTVVGTLILDPDDLTPISAVLDPANDFGYFAGPRGQAPKNATASTSVVKVRLSTLTRIGRLTIAPKPCPLCSWRLPFAAAIDPTTGFAYFTGDGATDETSVLIKVRLSDFTVAGTVDTSNFGAMSLALDPGGDAAYVGGYGGLLGGLSKIQLSSFTLTATLYLSPPFGAMAPLDTAVIDPAGGYAYFGAESYPGDVFRVALSDFSNAGRLSFQRGDDTVTVLAPDPAGGYLYAGTSRAAGPYVPGQVLKIRLSDFSRVGGTVLAAG